jgi:hypothetical protein
MPTLDILIGWVLAIFLALLELTVVVWIWRGKIVLTNLINEAPPKGSPIGTSGDASMSRFQLLVFVFVIAVSYFYLVICARCGTDPGAAKLPDVPPSVLALLGISGGSYILSKGIQSARDTQLAETAAKSNTP